MNKSYNFPILFAVLILIIYGQSMWGGFVFDDRGILEYSRILSSLASLPDAALQPYWEVSAGLYRPVTLLSYALNIIFLGGSAMSFHLVNLAIYFGIVWAIFSLIKRLFHDERLALLSALVYLVLPIHTEVVANITGRSELLSLFFSLLLLIEFTKDPPRVDESPRVEAGRVNFWLAGLYMLLAIGAKETAIAALPLVLLVLLIREDVTRSNLVQMFQKYFRPISATVVGACIYFFGRFFVLGPDHFLGVQTSLIENPLLFASVPDRIATALSIFSMYVEKTFWPVGLCSDYSFNQIPVLGGFLHFATIFGAAVLISSLVATVYFLKRQPVIALSSGFVFFGTILVSNILFPIGTIAGERLFFFPSLGLAILLALFLLKINKKAVTIGLLVLFAALSFHRQGVWMTEEKLFLNAAECAPESVLSLSNLGTVYYFRGEYTKAEEVFLKSIEIKPIYSKGLNNLGLVYWKQGREREARDLYHASLKQKYPYPGAIENLILLYGQKGDQESALRWLRIAYPNVDDFALRNLF